MASVSLGNQMQNGQNRNLLFFFLYEISLERGNPECVGQLQEILGDPDSCVLLP